MKNLRRKLKKTKKSYRVLFYTILLFYLVSIIFITKSLLLLSGIETLIRYIVISVFVLLFLFYYISGLVFLIMKKHGSLVITSIIAILLTCVNVVGYYYIDKTYGYINQISKNSVVYTTNLISLAGSNEIKTVGMISEKSDIEGYILPTEYLTTNKNSYEITTYEDYFTLLNDLYDKKIDGIFITSNFELMYNNIEKFVSIGTDVKIIDSHSKEIENQNILESTNKPVSEPFSVLIMGVDSQHDGLSQNAAFNGDALMLVTFNPKTLSATVFSIPRDTYVPIACNNNKSYKINSAAAYGSKCMINTVENLTGITVDYYMKINFRGVVSLVEALGGIYVDVPKPDFPSEYCLEDSNRIYKNICLTAGPQNLNGEQALALSRVRKAFLLGDFKRVQNQQLVIEAMVQKLKQIRNINDFYNILNAISRNLDTNMSTKEMLNFYNIGKNILAKSNFGENEFINIQKTYLTGYDLTLYIGGYNTYTFQYYEESLNEIVTAMKINLEIQKPEPIKTFEFSINDPYEIEVIGKKYTTGKRNETLPSFVGKTVDYLENWNTSRGLTLNREYRNSNICINNEILEQSIHSGTLISSISSLNVTVCKNIIESSPIEDETPDPIIDMVE